MVYLEEDILTIGPVYTMSIGQLDDHMTGYMKRTVGSFDYHGDSFVHRGIGIFSTKY